MLIINKTKLVLSIIISLLTTSLISSAVLANDKVPNYVGVKENQEIIWKTEFDNDPLEEYLEDCGANESFIEATVDYFFDGPIDSDVEGWRVYILKIYEEEERDYKGEDVEYIELLFNWYTTESWDAWIKEWDKEEKNENGGIAEYDKDAYLDAMFYSFGLFKIWVSNDVDWSELADEFEEDLEDDNEDGSAGTETTTFFFQKQKCGINTEWEPKITSKTEEHESISRYSQDGILLYYEWSYDGDSIMKIELDNSYIIENWWWMLLLLILALIGIVIVVVVVRYYKK